MKNDWKANLRHYISQGLLTNALSIMKANGVKTKQMEQRLQKHDQLHSVVMSENRIYTDQELKQQTKLVSDLMRDMISAIQK